MMTDIAKFIQTRNREWPLYVEQQNLKRLDADVLLIAQSAFENAFQAGAQHMLIGTFGVKNEAI